jgi:hypothetical protein
MEPGLSGQLPTSQPYGPTLPYYGNAMPDWHYTGLESVGAIPDPNIIDWVVVELRDAPDAGSALPATAVVRKVGFLKNNGQIVDLDGISMLSFAVTPVNDLFAVVWHRNHVGIMSNALTLGGGTVSYDFSSGSGQVYGGGAAHKLLGGSTWGMIAGDADGNGGVEMADKTNAWDVVSGQSGYLPADFNFDQQADNKDKNDLWLQNLGTGSAIPE